MGDNDVLRLWDALEKIKEKQGSMSEDIADLRSVLTERCQARETSINRALESLIAVDGQQSQALASQDKRINALELSRAKLLGYAAGISSFTGIVTALVITTITGGGT